MEAKTKTRFKIKAAVFLLLIQGDEILLLRRFNTGIDDGRYVVPMGCINGNETVTEALFRESKEEANIVPVNPRFSHVMHRCHKLADGSEFEQIDFFFTANDYLGTLQNNEPDKCDELAFYPINQLPDKTVSFIRSAISMSLSNNVFSEFGWH